MRRPLSQDEKALLKQYSKNPAVEMIRGIFFGGIFFVSLCFLVLYALWSWLGPKLGAANPRDNIEVLIGLSILAFTLMIVPDARKMYAFAKNNKLSAASKQDLATGEAEVFEYSVQAAAELREYEDEGTGFFLDIGQNRVLYVQGQDLYDYAHDAEDEDGKPVPRIFPSTRIIFARAPQSGLRLKIDPAGEYLEPALLKARPFNAAHGEFPEDGTIYEGNLNDVLLKFRLSRDK